MSMYPKVSKRQSASVPWHLSDMERRFETDAQEFLRVAPYEALRLFSQCLIDSDKSRKFEAMGKRLTAVLALKSVELSRELKFQSIDKSSPHFLKHLNQ
jgi:hypothetical protein